MLARPVGVDRRDDQVVLCTTLNQKIFLISLTMYISMCRLSATLFAMTKFGMNVMYHIGIVVPGGEHLWPRSRCSLFVLVVIPLSV
jgi:hypothetical protein